MRDAVDRRRVEDAHADQAVGLGGDRRGRRRGLAPLRRRGGRGPDLVERVDHVLGVGLRGLQHVGSTVGDVRRRREGLGDEVRRREAPEDVGDVQQVTLAQRVVDGQVAHGGADERVDGEGIGDREFTLASIARKKASWRWIRLKSDCPSYSQ